MPPQELRASRVTAELPIYHGAEIDATARRQDVPPKFVEIAYELRIVTDETERRVDLVHLNLRKYGAVFNTLAAICDVHGQVLTVRVEAATPSSGTAPKGGGAEVWL